MVTAETNIEHLSSKELYRGVFSAAPTVRFGLAGALSPESWELMVVKTYFPAKELVSIQYTLTLYAKIPNNPHGGVTGNYGYPVPGCMSEYAYGYGAAGLISDVPQEIVDEVQRITGFDFAVKEEPLNYEYSYSHEENNMRPIADPIHGIYWHSTREAAEAARANDLRWTPKTFLIRRLVPSIEKVD